MGVLKNLRNKGGFTLVEMLIAISVMSIVGLGCLYMMSNGQRAIQTVNSSGDFDTLSALVRNSLNSDNGCKGTFTPNPALSTTGTPIGTIVMPDGVTPIFKNGVMPTSDFASYDIKLKNMGTIGFGAYVMQLSIIATRNPGSYFGNNPSITVTETFPMYSIDGVTASCLHSTIQDGSYGWRSPATGINVQGAWTEMRYGTALYVPIPPPGTVDFFTGAGITTGPGATVACPLPGCQITMGNGGWTGIAYKTW